MKNLIAEMARYGVRIIDIQSLLKCSERTVRNKLNNERDFTIPEALKIRNTFFPGMSIEYLFATEPESENRPA